MRKLWVVVATMEGDIEVAIEVAETLEAAIFRAVSDQHEIATENGYDEEEVESLGEMLAESVMYGLDNGRKDYTNVEDDLGITWRFKRTTVRTKT